MNGMRNGLNELTKKLVDLAWDGPTKRGKESPSTQLSTGLKRKTKRQKKNYD